MPNWTTNKITFNTEEDLKKVLEYAKSDDGIFDFDRFIPEPRTLEDCPEIYRADSESHIEPYKDRPWFNWYDWHCAMWGTKWNACDPCVDEDGRTLCFETAWSSPMPVILKLADTFPDICFRADSFDEDIGAVFYVYEGDGSKKVSVTEDPNYGGEDEEYEDG